MRAVAPWHGRFVAAGSTEDRTGTPTASVWVSDDGLAWRRASVPGAARATALGITASASRLVVVGETGDADDGDAGATGDTGTSVPAVWVSADAETWNRVESPGLDAGSMRAVASLPSGFVAVGAAAADDAAAAWTSADGLEWVPRRPGRPFESNGKPIRMAAIVPGGSGAIAAGWKSDAGNGSGVVWRSPDGRAWERVADQVSMSGASLSGVAALEGGAVAIGTSGYPDNDQASGWYEAGD
jgi:hypothetical protein